MSRPIHATRLVFAVLVVASAPHRIRTGGNTSTSTRWRVFGPRPVSRVGPRHRCQRARNPRRLPADTARRYRRTSAVVSDEQSAGVRSAGRTHDAAGTRPARKVSDLEARVVLRCASARVASFFKYDRRTPRPRRGDRGFDALRLGLGNRCGDQGQRSLERPFRYYRAVVRDSRSRTLSIGAGSEWRGRDCVTRRADGQCVADERRRQLRRRCHTPRGRGRATGRRGMGIGWPVCADHVHWCGGLSAANLVLAWRIRVLPAPPSHLRRCGGELRDRRQSLPESMGRRLRHAGAGRRQGRRAKGRIRNIRQGSSGCEQSFRRGACVRRPRFHALASQRGRRRWRRRARALSGQAMGRQVRCW